jgi:translation initiation factor 2B subunit (eIF-2B alpha/beta/delta family)
VRLLLAFHGDVNVLASTLLDARQDDAELAGGQRGGRAAGVERARHADAACEAAEASFGEVERRFVMLTAHRQLRAADDQESLREEDLHRGQGYAREIHEDLDGRRRLEDVHRRGAFGRRRAGGLPVPVVLREPAPHVFGDITALQEDSSHDHVFYQLGVRPHAGRNDVMDEELRSRIEVIHGDVSSSATVILTHALAMLREVAQHRRRELIEFAEALRDAQPSMAGLWTIAERVRRADDPRAEIDAFSNELARAPARISRQATPLILLRRPGAGGPVRLVTCSSSAAVEQTIVDVGRRVSVVACCAESRPALEGRALASRLAAAGVSVEVYTDAGVSAAVPDADALLVGADALGPAEFVNKVGTAAVCAHASGAGVPVYVLAGREKVLPAAVFAALPLRSGATEEVWPDRPPNLQLKNPYFERIPWRLVSMVVTDRTAKPPDEVVSDVLNI